MKNRKINLDDLNDTVVITVGVFGLLLFLFLAYIFYTFLGTFILSLFVYYSSRPVYRYINIYSPSKSVSAGTAIITFVIPVLFLLTYISIIAAQELDSAITFFDFAEFKSLDQFIELSNQFSRADNLLSDELYTIFQSLIGSVPEYLTVIFTGLIHLLLIICITFYLLRDGEKIQKIIRNNCPQILIEYFVAVDKSSYHVYFGNILNAAITALIAAVSFNLMDIFAPVGISIPYPTLIALVCGIGSLIPIIGTKIVYIPIASYLTGLVLFTPVEGLWFVIVFFIITTIFIDGIPDIIIRPYVSGKDVHTGLLMIGYIIGPLFFGWYGLFLAPFLLVLIIQFVKILVPFLMKAINNNESTQNNQDSVENEKDDTDTDD